MLNEADPILYKELAKSETVRDNKSIRDTECRHVFWVKKCSTCTTIMESDSRVNVLSGDAAKMVHSELEVLVCSYSLAKRLQKAKVSQRTKLYWVEHPDLQVINLRLRENVSLRGTQVAAAYTSSELIEVIGRMDHVMKTTELYAELGRIAGNPDKVARLTLELAV